MHDGAGVSPSGLPEKPGVVGDVGGDAVTCGSGFANGSVEVCAGEDIVVVDGGETRV